jgi:hypothetical protein
MAVVALGLVCFQPEAVNDAACDGETCFAWRGGGVGVGDAGSRGGGDLCAADSS